MSNIVTSLLIAKKTAPETVEQTAPKRSSFGRFFLFSFPYILLKTKHLRFWQFLILL